MTTVKITKSGLQNLIKAEVKRVVKANGGLSTIELLELKRAIKEMIDDFGGTMIHDLVLLEEQNPTAFKKAEALYDEAIEDIARTISNLSFNIEHLAS